MSGLKLKPCPFCGGKAEAVVDNEIEVLFLIQCTECKAQNNAGYRKQEWISVEDRLPEDTQMCLAYATVYFVPDHVDDCDHCERIIVTKYYKEFGFMDWDVHYWMPLPAPPKTKGGEE